MRGEEWALPLIEVGCGVGVERRQDGAYIVYTTLLRAASGGYTWLEQAPVFQSVRVAGIVAEVLGVLRAAGKDPRILESAKAFLSGTAACDGCQTVCVAE